MSCPMSFGELNIPSSRAFWDDCDEDEPGQQQPDEKLQLHFADGVETRAIKSDLMFLIEGAHISHFAENVLLTNANKICDIATKQSTLHSLTLKGSHVLIAIIEEDLTTSGEITELLVPYATLAKRVITVTIKPKIDYKSENFNELRDEIIFWRGINSELNQVEALDPPNFFSGVAAGIASWRDNQKLHISSYIAYVDNVALDVLVSGPVLKFLQGIGLQCTSAYKPKLKEESHLYS